MKAVREFLNWSRNWMQKFWAGECSRNWMQTFWVGECSTQSIPKMVLENSFGNTEGFGKFALISTFDSSETRADSDKVMCILDFMSAQFTGMVTHIKATSILHSEPRYIVLESSTAN